jgi:hypothetical protein
MNDPKHPIHRPMPKPATDGGLVDPLVELSHKQDAPTLNKAKPVDRVRLDDDAPIALIDDEPVGQPSKTGTVAGESVSGRKITYSGTDVHTVEHFKRKPLRTGNGASRVKSFHGKYSDEGLKYLDNAINKWLDDHEDIEVKFVTSTVMTFEGKIREPALVLNVWY